MVLLHNEETDMFCAGTLISSKYVVSASHCVYNAEERRFTQAGEIWVNTTFSHSNRGISPQSRSSIQGNLTTAGTLWLSSTFTGL